eukprot:Tbor_TRINITY_DN4072_c0_g2::TRINITY_DN4072_c0_g2_i1::g.11710::m.11710
MPRPEDEFQYAEYNELQDPINKEKLLDDDAVTNDSFSTHGDVRDNENVNTLSEGMIHVKYMLGIVSILCFVTSCATLGVNLFTMDGYNVYASETLFKRTMCTYDAISPRCIDTTLPDAPCLSARDIQRTLQCFAIFIFFASICAVAASVVDIVLPDLLHEFVPVGTLAVFAVISTIEWIIVTDSYHRGLCHNISLYDKRYRLGACFALFLCNSIGSYITVTVYIILRFFRV